MSISNGVPSAGTINNNITNINYPESETYMAIGNTVSDNSGTPSTLPPDPSSRILVASFAGNGGDELLTPPVSPQPLTGGDYKGYQKIPLTTLIASGFLSDSGDGGILVGAGGDGLYQTPHAWLDMSSTSNLNNVGFVFGIERGSQIFFSQRVTGGRLSNANDRTNVSGGGFVNLLAGDKIYVWGCAELTGDVWVYDCNLGLVLRKGA